MATCYQQSLKRTQESSIEDHNSPILIHPRFDALYYSFYIEGLRRLFPSAAHKIKPLAAEFSTPSLKLILPIRGGYKVVICAEDSPKINPDWLDWADCYAKVNLDPDNIPEVHRHKILAIGPSFGVTAWGPASTMAAFLSTARLLPRQRAVVRDQLAGFYRQYRYRLPECRYLPAAASDDFVFFTGSLWKREKDINRLRGDFVKVCRQILGAGFQGGLAPRRLGTVPGFEDVTAERRYAFDDYFRRIKRSAIVFNTPGVLNCLGWKLGEYLALGKAIISVPLTRQMPSAVESGKHLHIIDGSPEQMELAVLKLLNDKQYRRHLETNARGYYEEHLAPIATIRRIVGRANGDWN